MANLNNVCVYIRCSRLVEYKLTSCVAWQPKPKKVNQIAGEIRMCRERLSACLLFNYNKLFGSLQVERL